MWLPNAWNICILLLSSNPAGLLLLLIYTVMWSLYINYSSKYSGTYICNVSGILGEGHILKMWNVCMYTSACGDIVNCTELMSGIYTDIVVSCAHEVIGIIGICGISTLLSHMTRKSHSEPHFDHFDPRNAMMPLIMLLTSHNVDASTNSATWPKILCCISFQLSRPQECNGTINIMKMSRYCPDMSWYIEMSSLCRYI